MNQESISLGEARRIALTAQGFACVRPSGKVTTRHLAETIKRLGLVQIDYINVLLPSHYLVPFSRLGAYDRALFDRVVYGSGEFTEQWAHEASIIPMEMWPLLRHRMALRQVRPRTFEPFLREYADYCRSIVDHVREHGPCAAENLPLHEKAPRKLPGTWMGTTARAVLEEHFARGVLASKTRRPDFVRVYDLAERLIPAEQYARQLDPREAERELLRIAARAYGIGTATDLADYFRTPLRESRLRMRELVESRELIAVNVEGWREAAYMTQQAQPTNSVNAAALLSPFDPVVWFRQRARRLFAFDFRLEVFVPASQRNWGYYVMPFLMGDRLVARVDLKADRKECRLLVRASYREVHAAEDAVAAALAQELQRLARWLQLESVKVGPKGNLARALSAAVRTVRP